MNIDTMNMQKLEEENEDRSDQFDNEVENLAQVRTSVVDQSNQIINIGDDYRPQKRTKRRARGGSRSKITPSKDASLNDTSNSQLRCIKYNGATIRIMDKDLKSKKQFVGKNAEILYANPKLGRYIGKIAKGIPHGYGVKTWPDGKKYQGNWCRGKMHGNGELIIADNESFTGEFRFGLPWGLGIRKWANGDYYEGEYSKGYQQGSGLFISREQGWKYDGQWEMGKMNGVAVCQWADGTTYTGEWKNC